MILIDLQKAFDTTDHQILIKKMKYLGFSKNVIAWVKLYLSEQKFKININTSYSSPLNLMCGVPPRIHSKPTPVFALHKWLAPSCCQSFITLCIVLQHKNVTEIEKQLLRDFSSLCDSFVDNKLSAQFGQEKTKSSLLRTIHKIWNAKALNIYV